MASSVQVTLQFSTQILKKKRVDVLPHCILTKEMCHIKIGLEKPMFHSYFQHNLEMDQFSNNIQS